MKNELPQPTISTAGRIVFVLIYVLFVSGIFMAIATVIIGGGIDSFIHPENLSLRDEFIIQGASFLGTLVPVFFCRRYFDLRSISSMGFPFKGRGKDLICGLLVASVIMGLGTAILLASNEITITGIHYDSYNFSYGFLLFVLVALNEEILCRGYILNNLMTSMNSYLALVISSVIFSLLHIFNSNLSWIGLLDLFVAGLLLGSTYIYTKNLWFPISFHLFWNFIQGCVLDYNVSGWNVSSVFSFNIPVKNSINGGDFGFEGSWLSIVLSMCIFLFIMYHYKSQGVSVICRKVSNP